MHFISFIFDIMVWLLYLAFFCFFCCFSLHTKFYVFYIVLLLFSTPRFVIKTKTIKRDNYCVNVCIKLYYTHIICRKSLSISRYSHFIRISQLCSGIFCVSVGFFAKSFIFFLPFFLLILLNNPAYT